MAFDPTKPVDGSPLDAVEICAQFNGLKDLIDGQAGEIDDLNTACGNFITPGQMNQAIVAAAAGNCDPVNPLNLGVSNPPTQAEVQTIANKLDELLRFLQRH